MEPLGGSPAMSFSEGDRRLELSFLDTYGNFPTRESRTYPQAGNQSAGSD